jgi:hypothetical protein
MPNTDSLVTFDLRRRRIIVEGAGERLVKLFEAATAAIARQRPEGKIPRDAENQQVTELGSEESGQDRRPSVREFARRFACRNIYERITVLVYYAVRIEGRLS